MFARLLSQLPGLLKDKEPDLAKLLNPELALINAEITKPAIVKDSSVSITSTLTAGTGISQLSGSFTIHFKAPFAVTLKAPVKVSVLIDTMVKVTLTKEGATEIKGIKVDGPGFLDPALTSAILTADHIEIKVGPITQKIPFPKF